MDNYNVFYSWQSDNTTVRKTIGESLRSAQKTLKLDKIPINIDESTSNISGAPNINQTVFNKIKDCDVFIADVTPITEVNGKMMPNSNVLIELGYALALLPLECILMISGNLQVKAEQLPFDINHHRILTFDPESPLSLKSKIKASIEYRNQNEGFPYDCFFSDFGISKNIASSKYIPETYLELDEIKERLRFFSDPIFFYPLFVERLKRLNFSFLKHILKFKGHQSFSINLQKFTFDLGNPSLLQLTQSLKELDSYLQSKDCELKKYRNYSRYIQYDKISDWRNQLEFMTKHICLITSEAGQGKTNFICDLAEHVLRPRHIPFTFINGFEIASNDIARSIAKNLYPYKDISFSDILLHIERYCNRQHKPFIILIDGINENVDHHVFKSHLADFINEIKQYDFIKLIITCRTEYFERNFKEYRTLFKEDMVEVSDIYRNLDSNHLEMLMHNYFTYFNIRTEISDSIKKEFGNNLLLFRIFCETYRNKDIPFVEDLKKDDLFKGYYAKMRKQVVGTLSKEGFQDFSESDIDLFLKTIVEIMINSNNFVNVPIENIKTHFTSNQIKIFNRFLDENILLKKDLDPQNVFNTEVINFTFDEFRDFVISSYLINDCHNNSDLFKQRIDTLTRKECPIAEGLIHFIFIQARKYNNKEAIEILKKQSWFQECYIDNIWELEDSFLKAEDEVRIKQILLAEPSLISHIIVYNRWNCELFKKLNLKFMIDVLLDLNDEELKNFIDTAFRDHSPSSFYNWGRATSSDREILFYEAERILDSKKLTEKLPIQYFFSFLIFFTPYNLRAKELVIRYLNTTKKRSWITEIQERTSSNRTKRHITEIICKYAN